MAADAAAPVEAHPDPSKSNAQPQKKRRRRATAGGATDDCFACRKRGARCDRKRPYCSPCIEAGKDCSGYKTTLTWGVGVASRGKLRGLACPVANKHVDGSDLTPVELEARRRKSSTSRIKREDTIETPNVSSYPLHLSLPRETAFFGPTSAPTTSHSYPPSSTSPQPPAGWHHAQPFQSPQPLDERFFSPGFRHPSLRRLQTKFGTSPFDGHGLSTSASSVGSWPDHEPASMMDYAQTPESTAFSEHLASNLISPFAERPMSGGTGASYDPRGSIDSYFTDQMSRSIDSMSSSTSYNEHTPALSSQPEVNPIDSLVYPATDFSNYNIFEQAIDDSELVADGPELPSANTCRFDNNPFFHLPPRLASLISYYDQEICPALVTFDGPENPYRKHVLPLAMHHEGLQNAIAAFVTNNLRMRRKDPLRRVGLAPEFLESFEGITTDDTSAPTPEEQLYKKMSIDQLNLQLLDARAAQDDSVLATLLILCLFHVCDSGFSKFKTQLSGMQKLLSLRQGQPQSELSRWVELFFAWFDVFTSTVNDREVQIKPETLDLLESTTAPGTLEQFSGCDFKLFKLLAKLGRLNLLAQARPVKPSNKVNRAQSMAHVPTLASFSPTRKTSMPTRYPINRSLSSQDYAQIDGNGWGSLIFASDQEEQDVSSDTRTEFWTEWHDLRRQLRLWQINQEFNPPPSPEAVFDPVKVEMGKQDLVHINECLRIAALLYTERLGFPLLPSSHEQFQSLVSQAFFHIANLSPTSSVSKFMLWPLFMVGTECVDEGHRHFLRTRCVEIQQNSGFSNNVAALEVLERVWRETPVLENHEIEARRQCSTGDVDGRPGQPFIWRKVMNRMDGEYLVV